MLTKDVPLSHVFTRMPGARQGLTLRPILEDCFDGRTEWISEILVRQLDKRAEDKKLRERREKIRMRFKPGLVIFTFVSTTAIFVAATVVYFTVLRHRPGLRIGVAFIAAVLMQVIRSVGTCHIRRRNRMHPNTLINVGFLNVLYTWTLAALMFAAVPHSGSVAMGLGITGGILLIFFGAIMSALLCARDSL